jgi:hypothetical protein
MESAEIQAKAIIAAALIISQAVEARQIDVRQHWHAEEHMRRIRSLTEFIYRGLTDPPGDASPEPEEQP